ncbi:intradiol ring-cleavage dioxygenase [Nocardia caishijiensis]|uniref:Protocatechuate 3,4-dioxygenase beta subunit n=1 Tax=Nocardia caishijiensis TaxID=184756 RepID=A0ABQ6YSH5_9NOCA|nr:intradiol ring-cleavage dioxygenase [Nocardia caishijiensis]KAF0848724.1 protocatechuate 3,4-dioxygenase beta subunit [Nocardia caishijiensis]
MTRIPEPLSTPAGPAYEGRLLDRPTEEVVDQGAGFDIATLVTRRRVLGVVGAGAGAIALAACSGDTGAAQPAAASAAVREIPEETNGPYPADGTNGVNILGESGIVRSDITSSLEGGTRIAGTPLTLDLTVIDVANGDKAFAGAAVYVWQCDAQGLYSMYSEGAEDETYLRGIQVADAEGKVSFRTIVPGCYAGRWTHIHFEIYPDAAAATDVANVIATSQIAFPKDLLDPVYQLDAYPASAQNLARVGSIDDDGIFRDGYDTQLPTYSGDAASGFVAALTVAVDTTTEPGAPGGGAPPMGNGAPPTN